MGYIWHSRSIIWWWIQGMGKKHINYRKYIAIMSKGSKQWWQFDLLIAIAKEVLSSTNIIYLHTLNQLKCHIRWFTPRDHREIVWACVYVCVYRCSYEWIGYLSILMYVFIDYLDICIMYVYVSCIYTYICIYIYIHTYICTSINTYNVTCV